METKKTVPKIMGAAQLKDALTYMYTVVYVKDQQIYTVQKICIFHAVRWYPGGHLYNKNIQI